MRRRGQRIESLKNDGHIMRQVQRAINVGNRFDVDESPFDEEAKLKVIQPTDEQARKLMFEIIGDIEKTPLTKAQRRALQVWKLQLRDVKKKAGELFTVNFYRWLLGRGRDVDHRRTAWGRQAVTDDDEVCAYVDSFYEKRLEFLLQLQALSMRRPKGILEHYLYYKYIVCGNAYSDGIFDPNATDFLSDWRLFMDQNKQNAGGMPKPGAPHEGTLYSKSTQQREPDGPRRLAGLAAGRKQFEAIRARVNALQELAGRQADRVQIIDDADDSEDIAPVVNANAEVQGLQQRIADLEQQQRARGTAQGAEMADSLAAMREQVAQQQQAFEQSMQRMTDTLDKRMAEHTAAISAGKGNVDVERIKRDTANAAALNNKQFADNVAKAVADSHAKLAAQFADESAKTDARWVKHMKAMGDLHGTLRAQLSAMNGEGVDEAMAQRQKEVDEKLQTMAGQVQVANEALARHEALQQTYLNNIADLKNKLAEAQAASERMKKEANETVQRAQQEMQQQIVGYTKTQQEKIVALTHDQSRAHAAQQALHANIAQLKDQLQRERQAFEDLHARFAAQQADQQRKSYERFQRKIEEGSTQTLPMEIDPEDRPQLPALTAPPKEDTQRHVDDLVDETKRIKDRAHEARNEAERKHDDANFEYDNKAGDAVEQAPSVGERVRRNEEGIAQNEAVIPPVINVPLPDSPPASPKQERKETDAATEETDEQKQDEGDKLRKQRFVEIMQGTMSKVQQELQAFDGVKSISAEALETTRARYELMRRKYVSASAIVSEMRAAEKEARDIGVDPDTVPFIRDNRQVVESAASLVAQYRYEMRAYLKAWKQEQRRANWDTFVKAEKTTGGKYEQQRKERKKKK